MPYSAIFGSVGQIFCSIINASLFFCFKRKFRRIKSAMGHKVFFSWEQNIMARQMCKNEHTHTNTARLESSNFLEALRIN